MHQADDLVATRSGHHRRVLLAIRDQLLLDALALAYRGEGFSVQETSHGSVIDLLLRDNHPDLVVVGDSAGQVREWSTVRRIRNVSDVAVLALVGSTAIEDRLEPLRQGADDALAQPINLAELLARTNAVLRRCSAPMPERLEVGDLVIDGDQHVVTRGAEPIALTVMEFNLLRAFCRHPRTVLSKIQLLQVVWGFDRYDPNVVEVHMSALRRKLEVHGPRLIHTVRGVGYVLRPTMLPSQVPA
jgi:two-component system OmpR family response regulator